MSRKEKVHIEDNIAVKILCQAIANRIFHRKLKKKEVIEPSL